VSCSRRNQLPFFSERITLDSAGLRVSVIFDGALIANELNSAVEFIGFSGL
jgi:hypothetical protein